LRRALLLIVIVILLIAGGYISYAISKQGAAAIPGTLVQTDNPNANVLAVTPTKGAEFIIFVVVVLGLLVGTGVVLALIFWLLNRQVAIARTTDKPTPAKADSSADAAAGSSQASSA
jgi:hypothetical protein